MSEEDSHYRGVNATGSETRGALTVGGQGRRGGGGEADTLRKMNHSGNIPILY